MKIKNIFFAAILVLAGFSCSMEDDAIMNDVEKGIEEATEAYTVLDFGVAFKEMATKPQSLGRVLIWKQVKLKDICLTFLYFYMKKEN